MGRHRPTSRREHVGWWLAIFGVAAGVAVAVGCICGVVWRFS